MTKQSIVANGNDRLTSEKRHETEQRQDGIDTCALLLGYLLALAA